jgi:hypothetical protein
MIRHKPMMRPRDIAAVGLDAVGAEAGALDSVLRQSRIHANTGRAPEGTRVGYLGGRRLA